MTVVTVIAGASPFSKDFSTTTVAVVVSVVTTFLLVIGDGLLPFSAVAVVVVVVVATRFAAGRAVGAETAFARAEAEPGIGFLAAEVVEEVVVADRGRAAGDGTLAVVVVV